MRRHAAILDNARAVLLITVSEAKPVARLLRAQVEQLHGIVTPEPVPFSPQTSGWWVLLAWVVAVAALIVLNRLQHRRRNRYRREAIALVRGLDPNAPGAAAEIAAIVKRTALAAYARKDVAALHGDEWAAFLVRSSNEDPEVAGSAGLIARAAYRPETDARDIAGPAMRWIRVHRA